MRSLQSLNTSIKLTALGFLPQASIVCFLCLLSVKGLGASSLLHTLFVNQCWESRQVLDLS